VSVAGRGRIKGEARDARGRGRKREREREREERRRDDFGYPTTCNEFLGSRGGVGSGEWEVGSEGVVMRI
jgi:hypothetical protein